jgi:hypothetical protein
MLRVTFHFKYIICIYFKWGERKFLYESLKISRWKDLNKINGGEEWLCDMLKNLKLNLFYVLRISNHNKLSKNKTKQKRKTAKFN